MFKKIILVCPDHHDAVYRSFFILQQYDVQMTQLNYNKKKRKQSTSVNETQVKNTFFLIATNQTLSPLYLLPDSGPDPARSDVSACCTPADSHSTDDTLGLLALSTPKLCKANETKRKKKQKIPINSTFCPRHPHPPERP